MEYALGTVLLESRPVAALAAQNGWWRLDRVVADVPEGGLRAVMPDWSRLIDALDHLPDEPLPAAARIDHPMVLAPLLYPNKLVCVGAVYRDHLEQMNLPAERWAKMPLFLRPPTTSIVGPGRTIRIPGNVSQFDWEIELAVVLAQPLRNATEAQAVAAIAGYTVGIDFGARDLLDRGSAIGIDLVRAKAQDSWAPMGPCIRPAGQIAAPQDLRLRLWVNDELKQDSTTANMLFPIAEQLATISHIISLEPGDVVFSGSPAGSARSESEFLKPGDRVRAEIEGIGTLEVETYGDEPAAQ
ncbi:MAG: hypothetical protein ABT11_13310 [Novosphingobium sp. SCN 66-18]|nr:MAG: hypothetical protein ABT11_13310 [Novosphingobium sp. SCN 66-18]